MQEELLLLLRSGGHEGLVGFFGGELLGTLDGVADGRLLGLAVDVDAALVLAASLTVAGHGAHYLEGDFFAVLLPPVDDFAFEVPVGLGNLVDVEVGAEELVNDEATGKSKAFLEVNGANERLKSVAAQALEGPFLATLVLDELGQPYLARQVAKTLAADNFGAHLGEEALPFHGVFPVKVLGHDGPQHRVAQVLKAFVVDAVAV